MDTKSILQLNRRRLALEKQLAQLGPLMRGSVVNLGTKCGNPNCRCTRGQKHIKSYYSLSTNGKTSIIYLGKRREALAHECSANYKRLLQIIDEMTLVNMQLLKANALHK